MIGAKGKIDDPDLRLISGIEAEFRCFRRSIDKRRIGVLVADEIRLEVISCRVFYEEADVAVGFGQGKRIISGKLRTRTVCIFDFKILFDLQITDFLFGVGYGVVLRCSGLKSLGDSVVGVPF